MKTQLVQGQAQIGDFVTYSDRSNNDGTVWEVIELAENHEWSQYTLVNFEKGIHYSDLRQHGWEFAS